MERRNSPNSNNKWDHVKKVQAFKGVNSLRLRSGRKNLCILEYAENDKLLNKKKKKKGIDL